MEYTSNKTTIETLFDVILVLTWILPMGALIVLNYICSGWNEGSIVSGVCAIPSFTPLYRSVMQFFYMSFGSGYWIPVLLIALSAYMGSVFCKIRRIFFSRQKQQQLKNNLFGFAVFGIATFIIFNILLIFFKS